ncbi:MAG: MarR family winged helix-turn-helix transcriptional regulator [Actinomycetales bacterium]
MDPQRPIGFWLKLVDGLITEQFDAIVEEHGVTRRQWQIMNLLAESPATVERIGEGLKPFLAEEPDESAADQIDELVDSGWVALDGGLYTLTEQGRASLAKIGVVVKQNREQISAGIPADEYEAALDVLQRMARNMGWTG